MVGTFARFYLVGMAGHQAEVVPGSISRRRGPPIPLRSNLFTFEASKRPNAAETGTNSRFSEASGEEFPEILIENANLSYNHAGLNVRTGSKAELELERANGRLMGLFWLLDLNREIIADDAFEAGRHLHYPGKICSTATNTANPAAGRLDARIHAHIRVTFRTPPASAPGVRINARLNAWPVCYPTDASPPPLRATAHGWGPMWL